MLLVRILACTSCGSSYGLGYIDDICPSCLAKGETAATKEPIEESNDLRALIIELEMATNANYELCTGCRIVYPLAALEMGNRGWMCPKCHPDGITIFHDLH